MSKDMNLLEKELLRTEAYNCIENLMARFSHYYSRYETEKIPELFADRDDTKLEMVWGIYYGLDGVRRCFQQPNPFYTPAPNRKGQLDLRPLASDVVEAAEDLKTAKGVWYVPGVYARKKDDGCEAGWYYAVIAGDFILDDGTWRIWHLHEYSRFQTPYNTPWGDLPPFDPYRLCGITKKEYFQRKGEALPDAQPSTVWGYHPHVLYPVDQPKTPESYDSFNERDSY
ncbi:MAG: nuclear transport factor 2 family protein [Oscillospiraceae bacterium]|nr:nuclear transport factor 2 family protein [Oscillospiraceae bacterium]